MRPLCLYPTSSISTFAASQLWCRLITPRQFWRRMQKRCGKLTLPQGLRLLGLGGGACRRRPRRECRHEHPKSRSAHRHVCKNGFIGFKPQHRRCRRSGSSPRRTFVVCVICRSLIVARKALCRSQEITHVALLEPLQTLISRLRREKREQHLRHVSIGDLLADRWGIARDSEFGERTLATTMC